VAEAVYFEAYPEALADRLAASAHSNEMIVSAIRVDLKWFWKKKNVRALIAGRPLSRGVATISVHRLLFSKCSFVTLARRART
jgi:hypothetical protein